MATTWHLHDGKYRVVVMNADGTPGIALGGGASVLLAGITILVIGLRNEPEPTPVDSRSPFVTVGL